MKERGLVSSYEEYLRLPAPVLDDARLMAEGESLRQERREGERARGRGGRR